MDENYISAVHKWMLESKRLKNLHKHQGDEFDKFAEDTYQLQLRLQNLAEEVAKIKELKVDKYGFKLVAPSNWVRALEKAKKLERELSSEFGANKAKRTDFKQQCAVTRRMIQTHDASDPRDPKRVEENKIAEERLQNS